MQQLGVIAGMQPRSSRSLEDVFFFLSSGGGIVSEIFVATQTLVSGLSDVFVVEELILRIGGVAKTGTSL